MQAKQNLIFCSKHPDCLVNRINPDPNCSQHAYCLECLIQMKDGLAFHKKLVTLSSFIETNAAFFSKHKENIGTHEQPEKEHLDFLSGKAEGLSRLSTHLAGQKEETNKVYDELKLVFTAILEKSRQRDLQKLDQELAKMNSFYESFEKILNKVYPTKEEVDRMLPSFEDLQKQLGEIIEPTKLQEYIHNIKQERIEIEERSELSFDQKDQRKGLIDCMIESFQKEELKKPILKLKDLDIKLGAERYFGPFFESPLFAEENFLNPRSQVMSASQLAKFEDFQIIKNWLPDGYTFYPKLLYRASKHGLTNEKFHELCDKKGPTVTLIHCLFDGAKEPVLIGGFLDRSWSCWEGNIESEKAFLFSLTSKIKCPLVEKGVAACGNFMHGPAFSGPLHSELVVNYHLKGKWECLLRENCYHGSAKLANVEAWDGKGKKKFNLLDYEVFAIDCYMN